MIQLDTSKQKSSLYLLILSSKILRNLCQMKNNNRKKTTEISQKVSLKNKMKRIINMNISNPPFRIRSIENNLNQFQLILHQASLTAVPLRSLRKRRIIVVHRIRNKFVTI
jgi:hypothetical protein